MRIKAKDIAKQLGISEATVSLAINNRAGVNAETRKRILDYVQRLEEEQLFTQKLNNNNCKGTVLMIQYVKNGIIMDRSKENSPVIDYNMQFASFNETVAKVVKREGYRFCYKVYQEKTQQIENFLKECCNEDVKGIFIMAAEMNQGDIYPFLNLKVPIVTGDNMFYHAGLDSFLIDNQEGISKCVDYLVDKGHSHIVYLAENIDIFNFTERREAFVLEMEKRECGDARNRIRYLGNNIDEVYESMCRYLDEGIKRTTAFVLESSIISLGVGKALLERQIRVPKDISLIGFDALPLFSLPGINLTMIKGTHTNRILDAVDHLLRKMERSNGGEVMKVYYKTRLIEGESVFDKAKYIYR